MAKRFLDNKTIEMLKKGVLDKGCIIDQLTEDETVKDALKLFADRIVSTSYRYESDNTDDDGDDELTDEDVDEEEDDDDDEDLPELCSECQCAKYKAKEPKKQKKKQTVIVDNKSKSKMNTKVIQKTSDDGSDGQSCCDCDDCHQFAIDCKKSDENAITLVAEEEKKKRKSEKKKLQKKKKRDKRKAEKMVNSLVNGSDTNVVQKVVDNTSGVDVNTNTDSNSNKKIENNIKNNTKLKTETKTTSKQKVVNNSDKNNAKKASKQKKDFDNKNNMPSNKDPDKPTSNKPSPKSDRESELVVKSSAEEEELSFSSAYVSQIAQRKSKPYINNQKTAQTIQSEAQDYSHLYVEDIVHKNGDNLLQNNSNNFNDNALNDSNGSNGFENDNNNHFVDNSHHNDNKAMINSKEANEEIHKYKKFYEQKTRPTKAPSVHMSQEMKSQNMKKSIDMAILANQRAETNKFSEAIDLFTQALEMNPNDYRFYVNRSYCYDSIQDFRSALKDADTAIHLKPDWPKCHYRRGKALAGLKNYQESEISLKKVLTLETDCDEALSELYHVRYGAIVGMGYDTKTATLFASQHQSIKEALDALSQRSETQKSFNNNNKIYSNYKKFNNSKNGEIWADDDIYISDDEYNNGGREPTFEETSPTNPFGWKALWIGNVSLNAKLDTVTAMFRKFGNLNYCNIFKGNNGGNFILVHYDNPESPRLAMTKFQGKAIPGVSIANTPLTIRFRPNKDQKKPNYDQRLESDECYYWRTTGCARGDKCLFKHIQANKGVDKQAWMCNPLRKGLQPVQKSQK